VHLKVVVFLIPRNMSRVKHGVVTNRRHKKILDLAKGYRGVRSKAFKRANEAVMKAGTNAYRDRRLKKRTFRNLWTTRINAAARENGMTYSRFMNGLFTKKIALDRKVLSEIAFGHPEVFKSLVEQVK
jgi:large subunit ribosomal protein L20